MMKKAFKSDTAEGEEEEDVMKWLMQLIRIKVQYGIQGVYFFFNLPYLIIAEIDVYYNSYLKRIGTQLFQLQAV